MSKEELLKYLIAEIDLIMHDKDYRFENANGTWYSRESCRDLTNEEVFEELRTELRQFADLEAKLAESEKNYKDARELGIEQFHSLKEIINSLQEEINKLKQQLAEKEKENNELEFIIEEIEQFAWEQLNNDNFDKYKAYDEMYTKIKQLTKNSPYEEHNQDKISFAVEQLEKIINLFEPYENEEKDTILCANNGTSFLEYIDNQINGLKGEK